MNFLEERIMKDGIVKPGNVLKVDSFLNHQMDIELMDKTLDAYSLEHIIDYFERVKKEGLTEHGFPRLTSDIGILIAFGKRRELTSLFCEMMDFTIESFPRGHAANDFSVREIVGGVMPGNEAFPVSVYCMAKI